MDRYPQQVCPPVCALLAGFLITQDKRISRNSERITSMEMQQFTKLDASEMERRIERFITKSYPSEEWLRENISDIKQWLKVIDERVRSVEVSQKKILNKA